MEICHAQVIVNIVIFLIFSYSLDYPKQFVSAQNVLIMIFFVNVKQFINWTHNSSKLLKSLKVTIFRVMRLVFWKSLFRWAKFTI